MKKLPPVVISGSIAIDRIMNFSGDYARLIDAAKLDALSVSVLLDSLQDARGGIGANICYSLALLGDAPILLGSVGPEATNYMQDLRTIGVDTSYVHTSTLPTASFNVITDGSQRQIGGFFPGAMSDSEPLSLAPWEGQQPLIVISPHDPAGMRRQVIECQKNGFRLFYDVSQQVTNISAEDISAGLEATELLILNDYELQVLCEKTGKTESDIKDIIPVVITTYGPNGSTIEGKKVSEAINIDVAPPEKVVDPTGAGDAYRAGFLHGYIRGWDLKTAAQLGAVCGAYAIEQLGTQSHSFSLDQAARRYQSVFKTNLPV
jgi:adenosine kinase